MTRTPFASARSNTLKQTLEAAKEALPEAIPVTSTIVDGPTVEDAVSKLDWRDGDLIMVGSSRLSAPKRLFLGSTAAKMLRVLDVPMMVVPERRARHRRGGVGSLSYRTNVRYAVRMGWHTGPPSWTEMERVLNGKPRRAGWPHR